jgi:N-terminal domain of anti-restriction factor ArdC
MEFSHWLFLEEQQKYVRTRKDISPKNPANSFLVLYGADKEEKDLMFSFKDELKRMGFGYYRPAGTYSIFSAKVDDAMRNELSRLGVDLSGYDSGQVVTSPPQTTQPDTPADQNLEQMHNELSGVLADDPKTQELIDSIERMIERIANSTDEAAKQAFIRNFFQFAGKFYNYSMHNQFLIWIQTKGKANYVATENQWTEKFGRAVRDHKSFISVLMPMNINNKKEDPAPELDPDTTKKKTGRVFFKAYKVYDVSSTVPIPGHPSPFEPMTRKQWSVDSNEDAEEINKYIKAAEDWAQDQGIEVTYEKLDPETGGYSAGGRIVINIDFKGINRFSTLVHELAHEILHWKDKDKTSTRTEKEIDAEPSAAIVLSHFGFQTKDTPNYLALFGAKGDDVRSRKTNLHKAAKEIINGIRSKLSGSDKDAADGTSDDDSEKT